MQNIKDIQYALFINLDTRKDREIEVINEFKQLDIPIERMNATKLHNKRVACSMSHLKCLQTAKNNKWNHVLIVEDDIQFLKPQLFIDNLNKFLSSSILWDVLLFAGNNMPPYTNYDDFCVKVTRCQTTTGYLVLSHYYDILINNIKEGIKLLIKNPDSHFFYAIDKYWINLQTKDNWFLITPLTVIQREGFSDIENKKTNYSSLLLDLNKDKLLKKIKK
jgi:GR25 family glycosyltransferase involved in LPS biosynthesis